VHVPGALPRAGMLRAFGASTWLSSQSEKTASDRFMRQAPVIRTKTQSRKIPHCNMTPGGLAQLSWICRYYWWTRICFHGPGR